MELVFRSFSPEIIFDTHVVNVHAPKTLTQRVAKYSEQIFIGLGIISAAALGIVKADWILATTLGIVGGLLYLFYKTIDKTSEEPEVTKPKVDIKKNHVIALIRAMKGGFEETKKKVANLKEGESFDSLLRDILFRIEVFETLFSYAKEAYGEEDKDVIPLKELISSLHGVLIELYTKTVAELEETETSKDDLTPLIPREIINIETETIVKIKPPIVFKNDGNRCYLNSSLQALLASEHFRQWVRQPYNLEVRLQKEWIDYKANKISEEDWKTALCQYFAGSEVQLLLSKLLNKLESEARPEDCSCEKELVEIRDLLFSGQLHSEFKGYVKENWKLQCDAGSVFETLISLYNKNISVLKINSAKIDEVSVNSKSSDPIPFIRLGLNKENNLTFQELINKEFSVEKITQPENEPKIFEIDDKVYYTLNHEMETSLELINGSPPDLLMIQLKRFVVVELKDKDNKPYYQSKKINEKISLPDDFEVDLAQAFDKNQIKEQSTKYTLRSIVYHFGSLDGGHYISRIREGDDWYECDDQQSSIVKLSKEDVKPENGYMYVLERKKD